MKLIVVGATGFVGGEVVRQALRNPAITSIVAITRRAMQLPADVVDASKFCYFVLEDWLSPYPQSLKVLIEGADACIWYVLCLCLFWIMNFGWAKPELGYKEPSNHSITIKKYGLCLRY